MDERVYTEVPVFMDKPVIIDGGFFVGPSPIAQVVVPELSTASTSLASPSKKSDSMSSVQNGKTSPNVPSESVPSGIFPSVPNETPPLSSDVPISKVPIPESATDSDVNSFLLPAAAQRDAAPSSLDAVGPISNVPISNAPISNVPTAPMDTFGAPVVTEEKSESSAGQFLVPKADKGDPFEHQIPTESDDEKEDGPGVIFLKVGVIFLGLSLLMFGGRKFLMIMSEPNDYKTAWRNAYAKPTSPLPTVVGRSRGVEYQPL